MQAKLNPQGAVSFPGFEEVQDFTSDGSESSVSFAVASDTDLEYQIYVRNLGDTFIDCTLNTATTGYGYHYLRNSDGTVQSLAGTSATFFNAPASSVVRAEVLAPVGSIKTVSLWENSYYASAANVEMSNWMYKVYDSTDPISTITFKFRTGTFGAGTKVAIYSRRSQS